MKSQPNPLWTIAAGRELDATPLVSRRAPPARLVACVNVWNDLPALKLTMQSWLPHVDHVIAVDGSYNTLGASLSTDGTREFLKSFGAARVTVLDAAGVSQCEKRTRYCAATRAGDYLFIVDADETVVNGAVLRKIPTCDVGWIRVQSDLYNREYGQPRLIRWQPSLAYHGRHHWMYVADRLLCTHQYGGPGFEHRPVPIVLKNNRALGRSRARLTHKRESLAQQVATERVITAMPTSKASDSQIGARESLQILNYAYRDDGLAPSRFHTAINRTTPHSSVFVKVRPGPFDVPDQYLATKHQAQLAYSLASADVVHYHGVMSLSRRPARSAWIVFHHHGSLLRANAADYAKQARQNRALVVLSNLELFSWTQDIKAYFLPNVVPVARYAALRKMHQRPFDGSRPFRIAHSPSQPHRKGTDVFLAACQRLQSRGVPIEPVMLHNLPHHAALAAKATCHASFDSFWLGMQCSGLETAAMSMPVLAGDATVAKRYREQFGNVPYTFVEDGEALEHTMERLVSDIAFYRKESERVHDYVVANHDESAVALRYLDLLDTAFGWRDSKKRTEAAKTGTYLTTRRRPLGVKRR